MRKKLEETSRGHILAEGEVTGHYHAVKGDMEMYEDGGVKIFENFKPVLLTHQEHDTLTIKETKEEVGEHRVGIVQEFDPFNEEARRVRD